MQVDSTSCHIETKFKTGGKSICVPFLYIWIHVGLLSVCCRFIVGLSSGLSVWCRLWFQYFGDYRFWIGVMSVIYRFQIGRFHPDITPTWARLFYCVCCNIVGGRPLPDSMINCAFLSVSCRFGRCDWGIISNNTNASWHSRHKDLPFIIIIRAIYPAHLLLFSWSNTVYSRWRF